MIRIALIFILFSIVASCGNNDHGNADADLAESIGDDSTKFTTIQWMDTLKDFGSVTAGQKVEIVFDFKNTGDKPLVIQGVAAACGCTVPEYTKEAVMPGKQGYVKAVFNSIHQPPTVQKSITVTANTKGSRTHLLNFIGEVKTP